MLKISRLAAFLLLCISPFAFAQQEAERYSQAVEAYQNGDFVRAEQLWTVLADQGYANAQYALGVMHLKHQTQHPNDGIAFQYLVEAAKQQHVSSMFNLGVAYWEGRGVNQQPEKAANWWEAAAEKNDPSAQYNLGIVYYTGIGRPRDPEQAKYWLSKAASNGHLEAQGMLLKIEDDTAAGEPVQAAAPSSQSISNHVPGKASSPVKVQQQAPAPAIIDKPSNRPADSGKPVPADKNVVVLYAAPNVRTARVLTLKQGAELKKLTTADGWVKVLANESYPVWVHESLIEDIGGSRGRITGNNVNIRPAASTDDSVSPPLGQLNMGDEVSILVKRSPWVEIKPSQPFPAWVRSNDLD